MVPDLEVVLRVRSARGGRVGKEVLLPSGTRFRSTTAVALVLREANLQRIERLKYVLVIHYC